MSVDEKSEGAEPWPAAAPSTEISAASTLSVPIISTLGENRNFEAANFLNLLAANEHFTFQTLDDRKDRSDRYLTNVLHGSLEQHLPRLTELNACGAGVFFTVNATDLKGRGTANITKVRAFFVDLDGSPLEPVLAAPLSPHIVVQTSPGRFHAYWLVQNARLEDFSLVQKALIRTFHADPSVHDLPRLMRLPGFNHSKAEPFPVGVIERRDVPPYEAAEFLSAFDINLQTPQALAQPVPSTSDPVLQALQQRGLVKRPCAGKNGAWEILCPNRGAHTTGDEGAVYFEAHTNGYSEAAFKCQHAHCSSLGIDYLKQHLGIDEEWPDPVPFMDDLRPVSPFTAEMLPEPIRPWLVDIAERMQVPLDFLAASCVVALGSLIGRKIGLCPKAHDDWLVVPNLWGAVVGRPSLLKSPAIAEIMKPIDELSSQAIDRHKGELEQYEQAEEWLSAKKAAQKEKMKKVAKQVGESDEVPQFDRLERPAIPQPKRYKTEDGTVEKIGELLQSNPQGLLIHRDELVGWLKNLDKYGREGDRAFYLESWNGTGSYTVDRIGRGTIHIPALCLSIIGGIQPGPLGLYVHQATGGGEGDDGLLQRFQLLVWPDVPRTWEKVDRVPDQEARNKAYNVFREVGTFGPFEPSSSHAFETFILRFDTQAQVAFDEWRETLELRLRSGDLGPAMESHLAKYRSLMPKLALIFHVVETVGRGLPPLAVELASAQRAISWCEFLETHAGRLYSSGQDQAMESARALLRRIKNGELPDGFSFRDVYYSRHWSKLDTPEQVKDAIRVLEDLGWVRSEAAKTNGRPSTRVRIHPHVHGDHLAPDDEVNSKKGRLQ
jgi:putative DNA primase/helicase